MRIFFLNITATNPKGEERSEEKKMATIVGPGKGSERTAMERFGSGGMALLPWTKQMLTVLWEQLRLLVQVIYYTFISGQRKVQIKLVTL